jgi:hypothetical protein
MLSRLVTDSVCDPATGVRTNATCICAIAIGVCTTTSSVGEVPIGVRNFLNGIANGQWFRTNNFPGNCVINRFISKLNKATLTAELGNPLRRITSSVLDSSLLRAS